jgi:hypothetical protein
MIQPCFPTKRDTQGAQKRPSTSTGGNASAAQSTALTCSAASGLTTTLPLSPPGPAFSKPPASPANSIKSLNGDRRRKLSSRDCLLIKLCSKTASLGYLAKSFQISSKHVQTILRRPGGLCRTCQKWREKGDIVLSQDGQDIEWECDGCIK